jgi:N-acetylneuraminic acid mutarotase
MRGPGQLPRLALKDRTLRVEMTVELEGIQGPLVADPGWSSTGSMAATRNLHTATLLPSGKVLVTGGRVGVVSLASAEVYDPGTGTWASAGSMATARTAHTATVMPNGKVLVAGGFNNNGSTLDVLASAEVYDPGTGTWAATGSMTSGRDLHTATLLPNGKVLVAGGQGPTGLSITSAELYDPETGTWAATGSMVANRDSQTATLLPNGKVLVAGGEYTATIASAEVYDPGTGTWAATGSLASARLAHTATLLPNGRVLVVGGVASGALASVEVYDPGTGSWAATGSMAAARSSHTATLLPNGQVLVVGGVASGALASVEVYDSGTGSWASAGSLATARSSHTATLLPSGKVLVTGGRAGAASLASAEQYDSGTGSWASTDSMASVRIAHTAVLLPNDKVLVAGGSNGSLNFASAEQYDPGTGSWASTGSMASARSSHTATLLPNGKVLVAGGEGGSSALASAEQYDPGTGSWASTGSLASARAGHTATLLPNGKVLVAGGKGGSGYLSSAEVYDPGTGSWVATGSLASARSSHTATLLPNGKVLVAGGDNDDSVLASAEVYDPGTGTWAATGSLVTARGLHTAVLLAHGKVLVAGGIGSSSDPLASAEVYDPGTGTWAATGSMATARSYHTAVLLPNDKVLVAGNFLGNPAASAEVYDPGTSSWADTGSMAMARAFHKATLLPSGKVLVVGGIKDFAVLASAEVYEGTGALDAWRPRVQTSVMRPGAIINVTGSGFRGVSEASSGGVQSSATDFPLLSLTEVNGGAVTRMPTGNFSDTSLTTTVPTVPDGYYLLTVMTNAIPGGRMVFVDGTPPLAPVVVTPASGAVVKTSTPVISGTAEAHSTVTIFLDGTVVGTASAEGSGSWSFTPSAPLAQGPHTVTATATDAAENTSPASSPSTFTVDTVSPAIPVVVSPAAGAVVDRRRPVMTGTAEVGTTVTVILDEAEVGTAAVSDTGTWSFTPAEDVPLGSHTLAARATDVVGNSSPASDPGAFMIDTRGQYWGCASAPTSAASWVAIALGIGCLHRRRRGLRASSVRMLEKQTWAVLCLSVLVSGESFGAEPGVAPVDPQSEQHSRSLGFMLGVRGEAEVLKQGFTPALTAELVGDSDARLPDVRLGVAFTALFRPMGLRAEGRLYPYDLGASGQWRVRPYLSLGATYFLKSGSVGARGGVGAALQLGAIQLFADAAYERFFTPSDAYYYEPNAVVISLGVGWSPFSRR